MSYKEREITVEFTLANGTFDGKKIGRAHV